MCVIKNFRKIKAFRRNAISKRKMISHTLPYLVMIFKLKNINNIQNFGNNLHSLPKKNNLSLLRSSKKSPQNFSTNLLFLRNNLSRSETSQKFKQTLSTL